MEELRRCQSEAIECFEKHFFEDENDRGIISMCCGAGKTRTTYEIIKLCSTKHDCKFFVYATSRKDLIYQTAEDFRKRIAGDKLNMEVRIVGGSGEKYRDLTLPSSNIIKDTINSKLNDNKTIIIITTYVSSGKIINAVNGDKKYYPDLIILDEAHNTTGENDKNNQKLIEKGNDLFSAERYLFLTATPVRLVLKNKNSSFQNKETTYTMSNKHIYGSVVYEYSFKDGADDGVILPFETIYLTQKNKIPPEIQEELKGKNKTQKTGIFYKTLSNFLMTSLRDYKLNFVLVYCKNMVKMELMEKWIKILWEDVLDYKIFSISSTHGKKAREKTRKEFRENDGIPHILLSVGMFDEGVDEPCIDAVFFAEERHTESRIVQNIGRCLRVDKSNPQKTVGYVLVPNIVIDIEDDTDDDNDDIDNIDDNDDMITKGKTKEISNSFSSYYKNIRNTCNMLQKPARHQFYKKLVKGNLPDMSDSDDDDKLDLCDKVINEKDDNEFENDSEEEQNIDQKGDDININSNKNDEQDDNDNVLDIYKYLTSKHTSGTIANEKFQKLKDFIKNNNINTISKWSKYCGTNRKLYAYKNLHNIFKSEWISWGDLLFNETFSYVDAKAFIARELKESFKTKEEWIKYYHETINNELNNKRKVNMTDELVNNILKIPGRPQEYYKGDWVDWNDILGLNDPITIGVIKNGNGITEDKAEKNICTLVNKDHEITNKFVNGEYNNIELPDEWMDDIKKLIDQHLGVNVMLHARVMTKKNGNYDKCCINCRINNQKGVPIVVYPEENKYKYDSNVTKSKNIININRDKEEYVKNTKITEQFEKIIDYIKNFIKTNKGKHCADNDKNNDKLEFKDDNINKIAKIEINENTTDKILFKGKLDTKYDKFFSDEKHTAKKTAVRKVVKKVTAKKVLKK